VSISIYDMLERLADGGLSEEKLFADTRSKDFYPH